MMSSCDDVITNITSKLNELQKIESYSLKKTDEKLNKNSSMIKNKNKFLITNKKVEKLFFNFKTIFHKSFSKKFLLTFFLFHLKNVNKKMKNF